MNYSGGLTAMGFLVAAAIIVILLLQNNDYMGRARDVRLSDQDKVLHASRLIIQSATQQHPLFSYSHALEAKFILDGVVSTHGGIAIAEKNLALERGSLEKTVNDAKAQVKIVEGEFMDKIIKHNANFDLELNRMASLQPKKRVKRLTKS
jgi:hypothetical protein